MTDAFPPIDSYGFLSDTHTAALVAPDATIEWLCVPHFDGPSVFARLLDRRTGGAFSLHIAGDTTPARRYLPDTLVLASEFTTPDGTVTVHDFLAVRAGAATEQDVPIHADRLLVRRVRVDSGTIRLTATVDARPDYGRQHPDWTSGNDGWLLPGAGLCLVSDLPFRLVDSAPRVEVELTEGDTATVALSYGGSAPAHLDPTMAERLFRETCDTWRGWSGRSDYAGVGHRDVRRSALVLRGLAFDESGALLAAPTTSLPEELGGERNWDYRYTWHRDAALLLIALFRLGHSEEGGRYLRFLINICTGSADRLTPMAGIQGSGAEEQVVESLGGYADSRPVRIGNEAFDQEQFDTYGHVLDAALAYQQLTGDLQADQWAALRRHVDAAANRWREPDHGTWEIRGECRHYVNSKVMLWVCLDRGIRLAEIFGDRAAALRWRPTRDEIHADVLSRGFDAGVGSFVQSYGSTALDASLLRIPLVGFLPGDDPRVVSTVERIQQRLGVGPALIKRYDVGEVDDGLAGTEGAFLISSFELVSALVLAGRRDEAREIFDWLCRHSGPLGLFAEQLCADGTALGNYPQAFTHLALIEAAMNLDGAGDRDALHAWAERGGMAGP
ncbi:glycoside hydrolase family 15 protein [Micromonospora sonneratiae]|uniref:Glycoside hydrolase family 15 protein n=1 Tax=Micromonospora sonneratiae TaxID=1184706 RepID=A0ABW3Y7P7_9ACTN